ncbi:MULTISPECIES: ROK family protein [Olivibacter]|jgi:glucokinase|uniref:ROK family protein n=1 Tax=Olivibacter oleidegradans TaxID=760123 RepID=A0ABV6HGK4_9SPHI|nr:MULTISPECIES: ROK family protein [Olivibacter]MDM8176637.1 ROK family protein [Olivibacter sp. 47]QEL00467.1 ROK family protein [Olivibacter sp. LS-1]
MVIGVDIGGTNIRAGLIENGVVIHQNQCALQNKDSMDATLYQLIETIKPLTTQAVEGIGIGVPSVVDIEQGVVYDVANIPAWKRLELKRIVQERLHLPVKINNDVNCFTLGEYHYGVAKGIGSLIGVTIGTGMGAGLILNHQLYMGHNCGAGEIGLLPYLNKTLEEYVGSQFFMDRMQKSAEEIAKEAIGGDHEAIRLWEEFGLHVGEALKIMLYAYDPEVVVLGGSISKAYPLFKKSMEESMRSFAYSNTLQKVRVLASEHSHIALLGAASLIQFDMNVLAKGTRI